VPTRAEWEAGAQPSSERFASAPVSTDEPAPVHSDVLPRPLGTLMGFALAGIAISALALIFFIVETGRWIGDVNSFIDTGSVARIGDGAVARHDIDVARLLIALADLVTAAVFLPWFFLAYRNLEARGSLLRYTRGWSIGSWFIPFFNLVRPKQIANDLWRGSHNPGESLRLVRPGSVSALVHWWWALYIGGGLVYGIGVLVADSRGSLGDSAQQILSNQRSGFYVAIVGVLALLASLVLLALIVYRITQAQDARRDWRGA
jgi:hypothetical protein